MIGFEWLYIPISWFNPAPGEKSTNISSCPGDTHRNQRESIENQKLQFKKTTTINTVTPQTSIKNKKCTKINQKKHKYQQNLEKNLSKSTKTSKKTLNHAKTMKSHGLLPYQTQKTHQEIPKKKIARRTASAPGSSRHVVAGPWTPCRWAKSQGRGQRAPNEAKPWKAKNHQKWG
jgi:hypothetical protein